MVLNLGNYRDWKFKTFLGMERKSGKSCFPEAILTFKTHRFKNCDLSFTNITHFHATIYLMPFVTYFLSRLSFFRTVLCSQQNWIERKRKSCLHTNTLTPQRTIFVIIVDPVSMHHYHKKLIIYIGVHSWCIIFYGF